MPGLGYLLFEFLWAVLELVFFGKDDRAWIERWILGVLSILVFGGVLGLAFYLYPLFPMWQVVLAIVGATVAGGWLLLLVSAWLLDWRLGHSWRQPSSRRRL